MSGNPRRRRTLGESRGLRPGYHGGDAMSSFASLAPDHVAPRPRGTLRPAPGAPGDPDAPGAPGVAGAPDSPPTTSDRAAAAAPPSFDPRLEPIVARVHSGTRLSVDDGLLLYETPDIWTVAALAHTVRTRLHGDVAYYNVNRHLNYSNICALSCSFCSFFRKKGDDGAYERSLEEIRDDAIKAAESGATEIHIVGGLHPWLPFSYYTDMMRTIRDAAPQLHIKAFTAVEIVHLARISRRGREGYEGIKAVLRDLIDAGLGSLPGGGAEVFDDRVHDEAFRGKIRAGTWLDVHRAAHELGLNSNATMLYGHVEQRAERVRHMDVLRRAQDEALARLAGVRVSRLQGVEQEAAVQPAGDEAASAPPRHLDTSAPPPSAPRNRLPSPLLPAGFFQAVILLPFFPDDSALEHLPAPTGLENLRTLAIARLMLDNIPHVKAFWIMQTLGMAQLMLQSGADDIDGTVVWYDITKLVPGVGGVSTHQEVTAFDLQKAIREAGFRPVERDTLYRPVIREGNRWRVTSL
jgi:aminodeoxyfutalosine synthase